MKFSYARKNLICKYCGGEISRGDVMIRTFYTRREVGLNIILCYHWECYLKAYEEKIRVSALYWLKNTTPPKKIGRPRKYRNIKKAQNLTCLLAYHKRAGNESRVEAVEAELKGLELL